MNVENIPATLVGDREVMASRIFDAPRELVYEMWSDPNHLSRWWGPAGFSTTTFKFEMKPGGVWRFVMHGPDGTDFENKITYIEVVPNEKLVYAHGGVEDTEVSFHATVTFESVDQKTRLTTRMVFPTQAARDHVVKTYGAMEGLNQHLARLEERMSRRGQTEKEFTISRTLSAPRELVWKAWTERERLMQWFGPRGIDIISATLDFRPGGRFHYCMKWTDGTLMWGKFEYRQIIPPRRIVWINSFSDEKGGLSRHPLAPSWPAQLLSKLTLAEYEGKTTLTINWSPLNPTAEEQKMFDEGHASMTAGWTGTLEKLEAYLARL